MTFIPQTSVVIVLGVSELKPSVVLDGNRNDLSLWFLLHSILQVQICFHIHNYYDDVCCELIIIQLGLKLGVCTGSRIPVLPVRTSGSRVQDSTRKPEVADDIM